MPRSEYHSRQYQSAWRRNQGKFNTGQVYYFRNFITSLKSINFYLLKETQPMAEEGNLQAHQLPLY